MIAILGLIGVAILVGLFLLLRSAGRFGQQPSEQERMRHNGGNLRPQGPRSDGPN
jgi:hypothetical protein